MILFPTGIRETFKLPRFYIETNVKKSPENIFSVLIFIVGTFLLFITPLGANTDEETYLARIWEMSHGAILPNSYLSQGAKLPSIFLSISYRQQVNADAIDLDTWKDQASKKIDWSNFSNYLTRATYFPTLFFVQSVIMGILGRLLDFPVMAIYYTIRFSYLLIYIALIYFSIRLIPFGKWAIGVASVLPMCIIQASAVSSDSINIGVSFLFISWILLQISRQETVFSKRDLLITCFLIFCVTTLKVNYTLQLILLLFIPRKKLGSKKNLLIMYATAILCFCICTIGWNFLILKQSSLQNASDLDPVFQLKTLLSNPFIFLKSLSNTLRTHLVQFFKETIGVSGYGYWDLPNIVYWAMPIILIFSLFCEKNKVALPSSLRIIMIVLLLFGVFIIFAIFYVVATTPASSIIWGVQGRYFLPLIPLLLLSISFTNSMKIDPLPWVIPAIIFILTITCWALFMLYHVTCGSSWFTFEVCTFPKYKNWSPDTNLAIPLKKGTKIKQSFVVECDRLSEINVWVKSSPSIHDSTTTSLQLIPENGSSTIVTSMDSKVLSPDSWMSFIFLPVEGIKGSHLLLELESSDGKNSHNLELGYTATNEYSQGSLWVNGKELDGDLVFEYGCEQGLLHFSKLVQEK